MIRMTRAAARGLWIAVVRIVALSIGWSSTTKSGWSQGRAADLDSLSHAQGAPDEYLTRHDALIAGMTTAPSPTALAPRENPEAIT
jgi:hypothetical protein